MRIKKLRISGAYEVTPQVHFDERGEFFEWYRLDQLSAIAGRRFDLLQANASVSKLGVLRGIHYSDVKPGQAKYVTCNSGIVLDYIVDIRVGSPTFGEWESVLLDSSSHNAVFISEGLGHAFLSLSEGAVVSYLVSDTYKANNEHGLNPLDPEIGLDFESDVSILLSEKDKIAPSLLEAKELGILPNISDCKKIYSQLAIESFN